MKSVGTYKGEPLRLDTYYCCKTYAGFFACSDHIRMTVNEEILSKKFQNVVQEIFKDDWWQFRLVGLNDIDMRQPLPPLMVFAILDGPSVRDDSSDGSNAFLAWLQNDDESILDHASKVLRDLDWEKYAINYNF